MGFLGYKRPDGKVGVRNYVVVMASVNCANAVVLNIAKQVPDVKTITHTEGCGRGKEDARVALRTLVGLSNHPNVLGVLIIGLGCEVIKGQLVQGRATSDKPIEYLGIQEQGGSLKTVERGAAIARDLLQHAQGIERTECGFEHLTLAMECGGSDAMSGVTSNPTIGKVADWMINQGGSVILSEVTEFLGTEQLVADRCADTGVRTDLMELLTRQRERVRQVLGTRGSLAIAPGNMDGGLSTIAEKSLGCLHKGGSSDIQEVLDYAKAPSRKGLVVMDTPGSDIFSITGMVAGGAQIVLFSTGRGSPAGFPIAPVIKVASNSKLFEGMRDDMDFNAGCIMDGATLEEAGEGLVSYVTDVAGGMATAPEKTGTELLAIHTTGPAL